jgi:hypothetical protein
MLGAALDFSIDGWNQLLLARMWITMAIVRADQLALTLAHNENAKRDRYDKKNSADQAGTGGGHHGHPGVTTSEPPAT